MKASIIYNSKSGITEAYAKEIGKFLSEEGVDNKVTSIHDYDKMYLQSADIVLLGSWTSGLFFFAQHPDKIWKEFAQEMPEVNTQALALFTTYKLTTGSMFRKMEAKLKGKINGSKMTIKSKNGKLTEINKAQLKDLISD